MLQVAADEVDEALEKALKSGERDPQVLNKVAQRTAGRIIGQRFRREPVVLAAISVL